MKLAEWLKADPSRTKSGLARAVGVKYRAILRIADGEVTPSLDTALGIERATGGAVTIAELRRTRSTVATKKRSRKRSAAREARA